jgi:2-polyprenyl-3-methyl-5-hydroxy-6-metoxy-1,4-benzoquinol methylase
VDLKRTDAAKFWDAAYAGDTWRYGKEPNAFLAAQVRAGAICSGGAVLALGDGEGRNGVWLAAQGFRVTSVDQSAEAVRKVRALATERGVSVDVVQATLPEWEIPSGAFDAVVLIFMHMLPHLRPLVHAAAVRGLRPGGVVILEAFTPAQLGNPSGGPPTAEALQTAEILRADFAALDLAILEETETFLDEGVGHAGKANVVRMLARRAAPSTSARAPGS